MVPARPARRSFVHRLLLASGLAASIAPLLARAEAPPVGTPPRTAAPDPTAPPTPPPSGIDRTAAGPDRVAPFARPTTEAARACSFTAPVCVHTTARVPAWAARDVLRDAESALSGYRALGLPMPLADGARGGTSAYDIYIDAPDITAPLTIADPETAPLPVDQSAAFTLFPTPSTWGCDVAFDVARSAAEASLLRLDAGAERGLIAASSTYLASIVAPCAARETPAIDAFQAEPWRAITETPDGPAGAMLFPMFLEEHDGTGDPGRLVASLFSIASQRSDPASLHWQNEPDIFDALRSSMRFRRASLDDLLLDFAVDRAFVGDRSDGGHLLATDLYARAGRVFFEWSIPYASLPRRLAPAHPLEPTGATYLWLDLANAPKDAEITFVADWELPAVFRWSLVKVDKHGAETGRIDVAGIVGATHVERTLILPEELAGILVVGTNTGGLDRTQPFDPDLAPFMPHAYEVTIYGPIPASGSPFVRPMDSGAAPP